MKLQQEGVGIKMDSVLPHLVLVDDDLLSTGIVVYHLKVVLHHFLVKIFVIKASSLLNQRQLNVYKALFFLISRWYFEISLHVIIVCMSFFCLSKAHPLHKASLSFENSLKYLTH